MNEQKHAWVERIGDECRGNDIPFFLEFVGYEEGADEKGLAFAKKKPEIVSKSMAEFTKDRYGVDVHEGRNAHQHEVRRGRRCVEREGFRVHARRRRSSGSSKRHASPPSRSSICRPASATRSSPSRSSWRPSRASSTPACSAAVRPGRMAFPCLRNRAAAAFRAWLETKGVENINNVNAALRAATSWHPYYGV